MKKILIAEDDNATRLGLAIKLEKHGHSVFQSPNGEHALDALRSNPKFDLLITDIMMPKMDGRKLVAEVRADARLNRLPIIMCSGVIGVKEIAGLLQMGVTWFLPKPVRYSELEELMERAFDKERMSS